MSDTERNRPDRFDTVTPADTDATLPMVVVAMASNDRIVTLEVELRHNGTQAWFTVTCPCGCDEGGVIVSTDEEALWLAAGLIATVERLSSPSHSRRSA